MNPRGAAGAAARRSPACCSSATRCSRSAASLSPAGWNRLSRSGVVTDVVTLHALRAHCGRAGGARRRHRARLGASRRGGRRPGELVRIDERVYARKLSAETRTMSVRMGKKFAEMGAEVIGAPLLAAWLERIDAGATPGCYPVSLAVNFAAQGLTGARRLCRAPVWRGVDDPERGAAADENRATSTRSGSFTGSMPVPTARTRPRPPRGWPTWPVSRRSPRSWRRCTSRRTCACS